MRIIQAVLISTYLSSPWVAAGSSPSPAVTLPCHVVTVHDGDTLTVETTIRIQVRLIDTWAPELKEPGGAEAKIHLQEIALNKSGILHIPLAAKSRLDQLFSFGRVLGHVWVDNQNVSERMIADGFATPTKPNKTKR